MKNIRLSIKSLFSIFCAFFPSFLLAGAMGNLGEIISQRSLYVGGTIGAGDFINKEMHTVSPETHQLGTINFMGGAFVGYDYPWASWFHTALEAFGDGTGFNLTISHPPYAYTMQQRYDVGVRVLPAYYFNPQFSTHALLGYVSGGFKIHDNGTYGFINQYYNQSGFQTGLGFTNNLSSNFLVRLDGIYNIFGRQNSIGRTSSGQYQTYSNSFSSFIGAASLIYQF